MPGSVTLMAGDPGIGKSTLLLQAALELSTKQRVFYVSGEESERQVKMRARRLSTSSPQAGEKTNPNLSLVTETNLEAILEHVRQIKPDILVIDSIQTVYLSELESSAGSVTQVRECASRLRELAKSNGLTVFIIGHVTKEGNIAGPRVLEHIVDTVLYLEGDRYQAFRLLRAVKNRFGPTSEVGVFEMQEDGLAEVENPSEAFLAERMVNAPGSAIAVTMEGTRPLLVEVQGLTSHTNFGNPRRTPNGVDLNRLLLITAVLSRHIGTHLAEQDVFVNVVGGLKINEPAADLAIAAAIYSSLRDIPIRADLVLIGETGLFRRNPLEQPDGSPFERSRPPGFSPGDHPAPHTKEKFTLRRTGGYRSAFASRSLEPGINRTCCKKSPRKKYEIIRFLTQPANGFQRPAQPRLRTRHLAGAQPPKPAPAHGRVQRPGRVSPSSGMPRSRTFKKPPKKRCNVFAAGRARWPSTPTAAPIFWSPAWRLVSSPGWGC